MTTMTITELFSSLFYGGAGVSDQVPFPYDIALNGYPYMLDDKHDAYKSGMKTIPLIRNQADTSPLPGEGTTNPEDLWPRPVMSWHKGAGQRYLDRDGSDSSRFWRSFGVDPWEYGKLKPLPRPLQYGTALTNTNIHLAAAGSYLYYADGVQAYWWNMNDNTSNNAALAGSNITDITSDGYTVWVATGAGGIFSTTRGALSSSSYNTLQTDVLVYAMDRLMAAKGRVLYNVTSAAAPTYSFTHPSLDWNWVDFTNGKRAIYAAGYAGDKSSVYRIPIKEDGTGLDVPLVAAPLPDGEIITSLCGYLDFVAIGTTQGFRLAIQNDDGSLTLGALVDIDCEITAFEPQDRFIYYSWTNFDGYSGMGRMDLSVFSDVGGRVPAYATDVMVASTDNPVVDIVTVNDMQFFSIGGSLKTINANPDNTYNMNGWIESGLIGFGNPDPKVALRLHLQHEPLPASCTITAYISDDTREFEQVGISEDDASTSPSEPFVIGQTSARQFELRFEMHNTTQDVVIERYDLRAYPTAKRGKEILVPIKLHEHLVLANGSIVTCNPLVEYERLEALTSLDRLVSHQDMATSQSVFVAEVQFEREFPTDDRSWYNGTAVCRLKVLGG
jgi:hypothetical protein